MEFIRFLLSAVVLQAHIWPLNAPWLAWQSVFAFYTLSGYLMCRVIHERYGFTTPGILRFAVNRLLRLWPAYLVVLAITTCALSWSGASGVYSLLHFPRDLPDAVANVTVLGLVSFDHQYKAAMTLMVPNSWSLSIEVFCYLLLAVYFARTVRRLLALALIGALGLTLATANCAWFGTAAGQYGPYCFQNRYGVLEAGFIPFAIGGLLRFYADRLRRPVVRWWPLLVAALFATTASIAVYEPLQYTLAPFVGSLVSGVFIILLPDAAPYSPFRDFCGRASYHLFIAQWVLAAILVVTLNMRLNSFALCAATLAASLALSCCLVPFERRIERWRRAVARPTQRIEQPAVLPDGRLGNPP